MASQQRVIDMVKTLSMRHEIHFMSFVKNKKDKTLTTEKMKAICENYLPIEPINYNSSKIGRKVIGFKAIISYLLIGKSFREYYIGHKKIIKQIKNVIESEDFSIIQIEYWYLYRIFKNLKNGITKVIDSHGILSDKKKLEYEKLHNDKVPFFRERELNNYKLNEINAIKACDLFISISNIDDIFIKASFPKKESLLVHTGQNLDMYRDYSLKNSQPTILFYGGMDSNQNLYAVIRFINNILPIVKLKIPEVKCRILGKNPPNEIKKLHNGKNFIVEGFVPDVRKPISKSSVMILPLELGAGFRSRIVEVLSLGVPVVGTHNALDNTGLIDGEHCYISDDDEVMANYLYDIMTNQEMRETMSKKCKKFVMKNFSLENTFGKLSSYYSNLK